MNNILLIFVPIIITCTYPTQVFSAEGKSLGYFSECSRGHKFEGEVIVLNARELLIPEFYYDGRGPAVWFHAMRKGAQGGIHSTNESSFYTLPFPGASCNRVKGHNYNGQEIKLILPVSIYELQTIGMLDYQSCHNFGNVSIPSDLVVKAAPQDLLMTKICPKSDFKPCLDNGGTKSGGHNCATVDVAVNLTKETAEISITPVEINDQIDFNQGYNIIPNIQILFTAIALNIILANKS